MTMRQEYYFHVPLFTRELKPLKKSDELQRICLHSMLFTTSQRVFFIDSLKIIKLNLPFILTVILFINLETLIISEVLENKDLFLNNWWNILLIVQSQFLIGVLTLSVIIIFHVHTIIFSLAVVPIQSFHINHWFQSKLLERKCSNARFHFYRRIYIKSLVDLIQNNLFFGKIFSMYLATTFPCIFISLFKLIKVNDIKIRANNVVSIFEQMFVILVIHYVLATCNSRLSIKKLLYQYNSNRTSSNIRSNLKMNFFIQTFHTRNPYGFTYGILGVISMFSLIKVCRRGYNILL